MITYSNLTYYLSSPIPNIFLNQNDIVLKKIKKKYTWKNIIKRKIILKVINYIIQQKLIIIKVSKYFIFIIV